MIVFLSLYFLLVIRPNNQRRLYTGLKYHSDEQRRAIFANIRERNKFSNGGFGDVGRNIADAVVGSWPDSGVSPEGTVSVDEQLSALISVKKDTADIERNIAKRLESDDRQMIYDIADQDDSGADVITNVAAKYGVGKSSKVESFKEGAIEPFVFKADIGDIGVGVSETGEEKITQVPEVGASSTRNALGVISMHELEGFGRG